jgi:hypothetical protein
MFKVFLPLIASSILLVGCPSSCPELARTLSNEIAKTYECKKPDVLYNAFVKACRDNQRNLNRDQFNGMPQSVVGWLVCKATITLAIAPVNNLTRRAECKYDFVSKGAEDLAVNLCTAILPFSDE